MSTETYRVKCDCGALLFESTPRSPLYDYNSIQGNRVVNNGCGKCQTAKRAERERLAARPPDEKLKMIHVPVFALEAVQAAVESAKAQREFLARVKEIPGVVRAENFPPAPALARGIVVILERDDPEIEQALSQLEGDIRRSRQGSRLDIRLEYLDPQ